MLTRRAMLLAPTLAGALAPTMFEAWANDYPTGPVTFMVAFPAGGSIDVVMRAMAPKLQQRLGKPVVIENRAGAGGSIAAAAVAKAAPDGLTLLAPASSLASNPALFKQLPFDTLKDLQSVALIFRTPLALVVNPGFPAKSVAELIALAKKTPGEINFGHSGAGAAIHLAAELFQTMTGIKTQWRRLSRRAARAERRDGRTRRADVCRCRQRGRPDQCRQGACAGRKFHRAGAGTARCADHRRSRRAWVRRCRLDPDLRAVSNAEADRRPAQRRTESCCGIPGGQGSDRQARHSFRSTVRRPPSCRNSWLRKSTAGAI